MMEPMDFEGEYDDDNEESGEGPKKGADQLCSEDSLSRRHSFSGMLVDAQIVSSSANNLSRSDEAMKMEGHSFEVQEFVNPFEKKSCPRTDVNENKYKGQLNNENKVCWDATKSFYHNRILTSWNPHPEGFESDDEDAPRKRIKLSHTKEEPEPLKEKKSCPRTDVNENKYKGQLNNENEVYYDATKSFYHNRILTSWNPHPEGFESDDEDAPRKRIKLSHTKEEPEPLKDFIEYIDLN